MFQMKLIFTHNVSFDPIHILVLLNENHIHMHEKTKLRVNVFRKYSPVLSNINGTQSLHCFIVQHTYTHPL